MFCNNLYSSELNLKDLLVIAAKNSQEINIAEKNYENANLNTKNEYAKFFPQMSARSNLGISDTIPKSKDNLWDSSIGVNLQETIYDNGRRHLGYKSSKINNEMMRLNLNLTKATHFISIIDAYYDYAAARKNLDLNNSKLAILKKQFKSIKNAYQSGIRKKEDFLRFRSQLSSTELIVKRSESSIKLAYNNISNLIGQRIDPSIQIISTPKITDIFITQISDDEKLSPQSHFLHKIHDLEKSVDAIDLKLVQKPRLPEVAVTASANYKTDSFIGTGNRITERDSFDWGVALQLSYTIWDHGTIKRNIQAKRNSLKINELNRLQSLESIDERQKSIMINIKLEKENYALNKQINETAKSTFEVIKRNYRYGKVNYLDYLNSITELFSSELAYINSYYGLKKTYARVLFHKGELNEDSLLD